MAVGKAVGTSQLEVKGSGSTSASSSLNVTDSAGTSRLFVRDDGNVGIGTTSPSSRLHVSGGTTSTTGLTVGDRQHQYPRSIYSPTMVLYPVDTF